MLISNLDFCCSSKIRLSLFLLLVGVGIASITDLQLNFMGTVLSLLAIITTCVGQIVSFSSHPFPFYVFINFHFMIETDKSCVLFFLTWCLIQLTNTIQKRLSVSSTQLLYQSAPFQAAILFVSGPFLDQCLTKRNVFAYKYSPVVLVCYCPLVSLYSCS